MNPALAPGPVVKSNDLSPWYPTQFIKCCARAACTCACDDVLWPRWCSFANCCFFFSFLKNLYKVKLLMTTHKINQYRKQSFKKRMWLARKPKCGSGSLFRVDVKYSSGNGRANETVHILTRSFQCPLEFTRTEDFCCHWKHPDILVWRERF